MILLNSRITSEPLIAEGLFVLPSPGQPTRTNIAEG